jgi:hypothetical protein
MNLLQKPVKDMTLEEVRQAHRLLWGFLAENPEKGKRDFYAQILQKNGETDRVPFNWCYACEGANRRGKTDYVHLDVCDFCPCEWGVPVFQDKLEFHCNNGYYLLWRNTSGDIRAAFAAKIRDAWPEEEV